MKPYQELINEILATAQNNGVDVEELLAKVCAEHMLSDEKDLSHLNGISFVKKLEKAMASRQLTLTHGCVIINLE